MSKFNKAAFTNEQLFAGGGKTTPVYGMGARTYGGSQVRGRTAHVQVREQNSGMMPAEDYRAAAFLPALWQDLERNGAPYTMVGGQIVGQAGIVDAAGANTIALTHQVMPANAGVAQTLSYKNDDIGLTVDIDGGSVSPASFINVATGVYAPGIPTDTAYNGRVEAIKTSTNKVMGNKPLAYTPTHVIGTAWNQIFSNQQFDKPVTMKTQWLTMYPVDDLFMYGGTIDASGAAVAIDVSSVGFDRSSLGYGAAAVEGDVFNLQGINTGDRVMPNPYLPGKLISVQDFVQLVIKEAVAVTVSPLTSAVLAWKKALTGSATDTVDTLTVADAYAYATEHIVGTCFKRQARAEFSGGVFINKDISTEILSFYCQVPELQLQGYATDGFEADQEAARQFAKNFSGANTADVVFIQFCIK